mgnify:CR=1 FL=1
MAHFQPPTHVRWPGIEILIFGQGARGLERRVRISALEGQAAAREGQGGVQHRIADRLDFAQAKNKRLKLLYATMARTRDDEELPIPVAEFILFVNRGALLEDSYSRYLESKIRAECPYIGLPVNFAIRDREKKKDRKKGK